MNWDVVRIGAEATLAVCAVLAVLWKVLLPRIRDEVLGEIKAVRGVVSDVRRLVGENHHANPAHPTMPDRLETAASTITSTLDTATAGINNRLDLLDMRQQQLVQQLNDDKAGALAARAAQAAELVDLHGMLAAHLGWSHEETRRLWAAVERQAEESHPGSDG